MAGERLKTLLRLAVRPVVVLAATVVLLAAGLELAPAVSGVPYNLRDLLRPDHRAAAVAFSVALVWMGLGPALVSELMLRRPLAAVGLPLWAGGVSVVAWAPVRYAVTVESLYDVLGAPVLEWGWTAELLCRFLALHGGVSLLLILAATVVGVAWRRPAGWSWKRVVGLVVWALPWLVLVRLAVVDWASTDNLTELIRSGPVGGEVFLGLLVLLAGANAAGLGHAWRRPGRRRLLLALAATAALLVPGWWLLNLALEPEVHKYGVTFPAVRFLLGPDRRTPLSEWALFLRWCAVQAGFVLMLTCGHLSVPDGGAAGGSGASEPGR